MSDAKIHKVGIVMNGVTGRMGTNQHLIRSILAINEQGGVRVGNDETIVAEPVLVWQFSSFAPGGTLAVSFVVTATPAITGTYANMVLVTGDHPGGVITDTDDAPVFISDPAAVVEKRLVGQDEE